MPKLSVITLRSRRNRRPVFKIRNDPRIFGQFLRKYSIDDLPAVHQCPRGEMSLVGPRPLPVYEINRIEKQAQRRRLSVKPGLTCLWQVSGRNGIKTSRNGWRWTSSISTTGPSGWT